MDSYLASYSLWTALRSSHSCSPQWRSSLRYHVQVNFTSPGGAGDVTFLLHLQSTLPYIQLDHGAIRLHMKLFLKKLILGTQILSKRSIVLKPHKVCSTTLLQKAVAEKGHHKQPIHPIPQSLRLRKKYAFVVPSSQTMRITHTVFSFFLDSWGAVITLGFECNKLPSA